MQYGAFYDMPRELAGTVQERSINYMDLLLIDFVDIFVEIF